MGISLLEGLRLTFGLHCSASAKSASSLCPRLNRSAATLVALARNDAQGVALASVAPSHTPTKKTPRARKREERE